MVGESLVGFDATLNYRIRRSRKLSAPVAKLTNLGGKHRQMSLIMRVSSSIERRWHEVCTWLLNMKPGDEYFTRLATESNVRTWVSKD
jgi:hypothetical protein